MEIKKRTAKDKKISISTSTSTGKQLWHLLRALFYMLKHNLFVHLHLRLRLRLERSMMAVHDRLDSLSCRAVDPTRAYYSPKEIEFSCSNTPINYNFFHANQNNKRKSSRKRFLEAEAVARAFEILNSEMEMAQVDVNKFVAATPSPIALWQYLRSPAAVRQLRVTDSPFPIIEEEEEVGGRRKVDREAEEFIKRFYEQLRLQPTV